jgi:hypothetical protein
MFEKFVFSGVNETVEADSAVSMNLRQSTDFEVPYKDTGSLLV